MNEGERPGTGTSTTSFLAALLTFIGTVTAAAAVTWPNHAQTFAFIGAVASGGVTLLGAFKAHKTGKIADAESRVRVAEIQATQPAAPNIQTANVNLQGETK